MKHIKTYEMLQSEPEIGDFVVCEETAEAKNGDIVVALLSGNFATLKRFYKDMDHVRLEPANSSMNPIITKEVTIRGKVVGVIRKYH